MTQQSKKEETPSEDEEKLVLYGKQIQALARGLLLLDVKLEAVVKVLTNKFMIMFGIVLASIWLPMILRYFNVI